MTKYKRTLQDLAIQIMENEPNITIHKFAERLGKRYQHAASLMTYARKKLGQKTWKTPTKVDKTMAILSLAQKPTGRQLQAWLDVSSGRAGELKAIAKKRLSANQRSSGDAIKWAKGILGISNKIATPSIPDEETDIMAGIRNLISEVRNTVPTPIDLCYNQNQNGHLLELAIPDLHLGRYSCVEETAEAYDVDIACQLYRNAVADLLSQAKFAYNIEQIVLPIGSDFLTVDNLRNTTSRGTRQDVIGNFPHHFRKGVQLLRETVETLRRVAPVKVLIINGNHDSISSIAFGELLSALYESTHSVEVQNHCDQPRKYIRFGVNLLGYAHGHEEKSRSLPMLMATEAASDWGNTQHREFHVGHFHHTRDVCYFSTSEADGVIVRVIPSLSAADRWHASKGFRSQRAALAFVYHAQKGQRAILRHSILEPLKIAVSEIS